MEYEVLIPDALRHLKDIFDDVIEAALDDVAAGAVTLYQNTITSVGAVLSGRFRDTVHVRSASRSGDLRERIVASEVPYSGVVEEGWLRRAHGQESYPGRHPAKITVESAGPIVRDAFENQFLRVGFGRSGA